jgi:hypothetical protein
VVAADRVAKGTCVSKATWIRTALFGALAFALGCAPRLSTWVEYDKDTDFSAFRTYDWLPVAKERDVVQEPDDTFIRSAVDAELAAVGLTATSGSPDLFVTYHAAQTDTFHVAFWGYAEGSGDVSVPYAKGTLVIDLIDTADRIIWRGTAEGILDDKAMKDEGKRLLQEAVQRVFKKYPASTGGKAAQSG